MEGTQAKLSLDMDPFLICPLCLRVVPVILAECYFLFLFAKEILKTQKYYDTIDKAIFSLSAVCIAADMLSILLLQQAISSFSYLLKVVWTAALFLVFLRFIFREHQCSKIFLLTVLTLAFCWFISIFFYKLVPVRYSLLFLYAIIGICAFHQILSIRDILQIERIRKKQLKKFLEKKTREIEMELLTRSGNLETSDFKPLSNPLKYHLKLRKSFSSSVVISLTINYFFLWDLQQSRNSLGQFFVVFIAQLLLPASYLFFTFGNQWIVEQLHSVKKQRKYSESVQNEQMR